MPNRLLRAMLVCALSLPPVIHAAQRHEGIARDTRGELVYREVHWRYRDGDATARVVLYRCPDGRAFARKHMRDSPDSTAPTFDFVDARTGYREGVRVRGAGREAFWQPRAGAATVGHPLPAGPGLVIDAGFDVYVQANWSAIDARGSSVRFEVANVFNTKPRVRDAAGEVPFSYQPDLLDPLGRTVSISIRKLFLPPRSFFQRQRGQSQN